MPSRWAGASATDGDSLRGRVTDSTGHPLAGATASLVELNRRTVASSDGAFAFAAVPPGRYTLVVRLIGYAPATIRLSPDTVAVVEVALRPAPVQLEPITVTATGVASDPMGSSLPVEMLNHERLGREQSVSLAHAVDGLAGVRTLSTGEQVGKPIIRGLVGPRVLVLDNGQRLEDYSWSDEDGPSVDPRLAERVEVIRGPASVLYGSDAIGGVINAVSDNLPDASGRPAFARGTVELYGGTNNAELGGVLRAEGASGAVGWRAIGIGRRAGNYHTPDGELYNTGFQAFNGEATVGTRWRTGDVAVRYTRYGGDFDLLDGPPVPEDNTEGPLRRMSDDRVQISNGELLGGVRLEIKGQWQRHWLQEVSDSSRISDAPPNFELLLNTFSVNVLAHHRGGAWLTGTAGIAGLYQDNQTRGVAPLVPSARTGNGAIFAFETATWGRWSLLGGARLDARGVAADSNPSLALTAQTRNWVAATGDLGATYRPTAALTLAANVGRAFRAPTLFELFANGPHLGEDRYEIGNPDMKPETSLNLDLSARWQQRGFRGELAAYRNQVNDYIYITPTGAQLDSLPVYRYVQGRAVLTGVELTALLDPVAWLTLRSRLDAVRGTNRDTDSPLPLMPPFRTDLEAEVHGAPFRPIDQAYLSVGVRLVAEQTRLGPFDTPTPGYGVVDLGLGLQHWAAGRSLRLQIRIQNAGDHRYYDFLSRYKSFTPEAGRNVILRLSLGI